MGESKLTRDEFLALMRFPKEWLLWGMYPEELALHQVPRYESGCEDASEHDRYGAFWWWIRKNPTSQQITHLIRLAFLDPDILMGGAALDDFRKCEHFCAEHEQLIFELCGMRAALQG